MSKNKAPLPFGEEDEATRAAVLARLFHRMSVTLDLMMTEFETSKDVSPKPILSKIIELQSVHFAVLKAQEAFLEKLYSVNHLVRQRQPLWPIYEPLWCCLFGGVFVCFLLWFVSG